MAYTSSALDARSLPYASPAKPQTRGLFGRMLDAMMAARMRQAEREVTRYLADTGGKFTDEAEREIERRFLSSPRW
jgi:hypothetical protein